MLDHSVFMILCHIIRSCLWKIIGTVLAHSVTFGSYGIKLLVLRRLSCEVFDHRIFRQISVSKCLVSELNEFYDIFVEK